MSKKTRGARRWTAETILPAATFRYGCGGRREVECQTEFDLDDERFSEKVPISDLGMSNSFGGRFDALDTNGKAHVVALER